MLKSVYNYLKHGVFTSSKYELLLKKNCKLFLEKRMMFIHVPKAAGVSLFHSFFNNDSLGHLPYKSYQNELTKEEIDSLFKFTFVRNPYERTISAFQYLKKGGRGREYDLEVAKIMHQYDNIHDFLNQLRFDPTLKEIEHFRTQSYWLKNNNDEINLDYIGRVETIEQDIKAICNLNHLNNIEINHLNHSALNSESSKMIYDDKIITYINELYAEDFERLHYPMLEV